ncbi:MAG: PTS sugar transporter subunit IIA [Deltaproteobacteria bacterium]|nr:PTS sugar transporter subunit IIA [Deltaproteobacteria bacterium]
MKLKEILKRNAVLGDLRATEKKGVLEELSGLVSKAWPDLSTDNVLQVLLEREKLGSTGVGNGVAIPHGKVAGLKAIVAAFGRSPKGVEFQSHDHKPARLFFVLLAPENAVGNHLQALARLSRLLKGETVRNRLIEVKSESLYDLLISEDEKL